MAAFLGSVLVRAPNHLGDGVMALPTVEAVARGAERTWVAAPAWGQTLYRDSGAAWVPRDVIPDGVEVALLLAPSFRAAWNVRRVPRRVGLATDHRGLLLTDAIPSREGQVHRRDDFARLAAVLGLSVEAGPRFVATRAERTAWEHLPVHVGLNPVSRSGPPVSWPGFGALHGRISGPVRVYHGPGEAEMVRQAVPGVREEDVLGGLGLGDLAGALARCSALVSNDTGVAHFAAACGVSVVVLHGSTTARVTGTWDAVGLEGPDLPCRPCYRKTCRVGGVPCLDISVERVLSALGPSDRGARP